MTSTQEARRRRSRGKAKRRTVRAATPIVAATTVAASRKVRRKSRKVRAVATTTVAASRKKRRKVRAVTAATVAASRKKRKAAPKRRKAAPKRRRSTAKRRVTREAWYGDSAGHSKAAKKGWQGKRKGRKSAKRKGRKSSTRRTREPVTARRRSSMVMASRRPVRRVRAAGRRGGDGMNGAEFAVALISGSLGYVIADGLDRFLATYDPTATKKPTDKFTSDGAGTLANALNVSSTPDIVRILAGVGVAAVPAVAAAYTKSSLVRSSLEGAALGAGISAFKTLWNNVIMGKLLKPEDTSPAALQKSYVARLYPSEVAAAINREQKNTVASNVAFGALSAPADVGPFALAGDSSYPDAAQALRHEAGLHDRYPTMQNVWGTADYPSAAQVALEQHGLVAAPPPEQHGLVAAPPPEQTGVSAPTPVAALAAPPAPVAGVAWQPGPASDIGPGPASSDECACLGDDNQFLGFVGDAEEPSLLTLS